jgi:hypothetical protein
MKTSSLLSFDQVSVGKPEQKPSTNQFLDSLVAHPVSPELNPYKSGNIPADLLHFLPPDGSYFSLFSDPYAVLRYVNPGNDGIKKGRYWLESRFEDDSFTARELKLLEFLSEHRLATRSQLYKILDETQVSTRVIHKFLNLCCDRGIITLFSWVSPLEDERLKPRLYGLTKFGAKAAEKLFLRKIPEEFVFHPIDFKISVPPNMHTLFIDLVGNELYAELLRINRVIYWKRHPIIRLEDGSAHFPTFEFEVIKDQHEFRKFWVEICRVGRDWTARVKARFQRTQDAYNKLSPHLRPMRLFVIADSDSRIPILAKMASLYMPDVKVRFTTDERLLQGLNEDTFVSWNEESNEIERASIPFFQPGFEGMTASEYFKSQQLMIEDDDDFDDESFYEA